MAREDSSRKPSESRAWRTPLERRRAQKWARWSAERAVWKQSGEHPELQKRWDIIRPVLAADVGLSVAAVTSTQRRRRNAASHSKATADEIAAASASRLNALQRGDRRRPEGRTDACIEAVRKLFEHAPPPPPRGKPPAHGVDAFPGEVWQAGILERHVLLPRCRVDNQLAPTLSTATATDWAVTRVVEKAPYRRPPSFSYVVIPPYRLAVEFFPVEKYVIVEVPKLVERCGKGKHTFANGDAEVDEFKVGMTNGTGKRTCSNGAVEEAEHK